MLKNGWKILITGALLIAVAIMSGCGGGAGTSSSSGALSITIDNADVASGSPVVATVTLVSLAGATVNGVKVKVTSNDPSVIATAEGYTNTSGIAIIPLPTQWVSSDKTVYLVANSDGVTPSTSLAVKVKAPKLTFNLESPELTEVAFINNTSGIGKILMSGLVMKFLDGNDNPITGQAISLYIDSITNKQPDDQVEYNPVQGSMIIAPPGVFTGTTDSSGNVSVPMTIQMYVPPPPATGTTKHVIVINWRVVAVFGGKTFTLSGSSSQTVTNAPPA